jgi:phosphoglycerate dehydrogenase-like enzyme
MLRCLVDLHHELACWTAGERERTRLAALPGWEIRFTGIDGERADLLADGADACWCWHISPTEAEACPGLKWISTPAAGADYLPVAALQQAGITVSVSHGHHGPAMAEHAMGMLISLARDLHRSPERAVSEDWWRPTLDGRMIDLLGARLVIVGYGAIGRCLAERAQAFGMAISGLARSARGIDDLGVTVLGPEAHDRALAEADAVVSYLPHTPSTAGWFHRQRLAMLPDQCLLVNCGRGETMDEAALVDEARSGRLRLGLDVFATEPLPGDHPFRRMPQVLCTPHAAAMTTAYLDRAAQAQALQMRRFQGNQPLLWVVEGDSLMDDTRLL